MNRKMLFLSLAGYMAVCADALSQDAPQRQQAPQAQQRVIVQRSQEPAPIPAGVTTVNLEEFLEPVADDLDLDFLIDVRSRHEIYVGGTGIEDITYPLLLSILRNNQLMAVVIDGRVNIVPESLARMIPVALVNEDDPEVADDEMVSRVIQMNTISAPQVVPILRPLLPQYAHLAALPEQNVLVIVDRYANVKRLTEIVLALDK